MTIHECGDCCETVDDLATHECASTVHLEGLFDRDQRIGWAPSPEEATQQAAALVWDACASLLEHVTAQRAVTDLPGARLRWAELDDDDRAAISRGLVPTLKSVTAVVPLVDQTAGDHR